MKAKLQYHISLVNIPMLLLPHTSAACLGKDILAVSQQPFFRSDRKTIKAELSLEFGETFCQRGIGGGNAV